MRSTVMPRVLKRSKPRAMREGWQPHSRFGRHGEQCRSRSALPARLNPDVRVLARAPYLRDVPSLKEAGANRVYSGEGEVALAFIEDILDSLGATPEQIDRERARAHSELSGDG